MWWDDTPRPGHELMARDAARLAAADADPAPVPDLLWFTWDRPTISLGRLQDPATALTPPSAPEDDVPVVVRPTGGRAVFHDDEWTYSAVVPLAHPRLGGSLATACRAITRLIAQALEDAYGVPARLAGEEMESAKTSIEAKKSPACFARVHGYEIVVEDRKLAGSAQRRGANALLQQGSLLVGPGHERIAHRLRGGGGEAGALGLARQTVSLAEWLGQRPDPAPFRDALARRWREASGMQAFGAPGPWALDSVNTRS